MQLTKILKTEGIISVKPTDTLSLALSQLSSSHDAAFVLDPKERLLGVVNPYHCLIKNSYPANAKVTHCMTKPPRVDLDTDIAETARLMMGSKIHYLPIYDRDEFVGIISARRILDSLVGHPRLTSPLSELLKPASHLRTVAENDSIGQAIQSFKKHKISKLIVVNSAGKLRGVLAFYDLISYLSKPKHRRGSGDRKGVKKHFLNYKVRNFMKTSVLTLPKTAPASSAVKLILDKQIGSVVVVDRKMQPLDIITTKDIFQHCFRSQVKKTRFRVVGKNLSRMSRRIIPIFSRRLQRLISRKQATKEATLYVEEEKRGLFKIFLSLIPQRGKGQFIRREGRDLEEVLTEVKDTARRLQTEKPTRTKKGKK